MCPHRLGAQVIRWMEMDTSTIEISLGVARDTKISKLLFGRIRNFVIQICWPSTDEPSMAPAALLQGEAEMAVDNGGAMALGLPDGRKDRVVHARFRAAELAAIDGAAEAAGLTVSAFLRSLTLEGAGVSPFLTDDDRAVFEMLISDMRSVGVNLNQLTRSANAIGRLSDAELAVELVEVRRLVAAVVLELHSFAARAARRRQGAA
jgi:hypothetical protein